MVRVLLCGDLKGRLQQLADQVAKLHAKLPPEQHFKAVFCVGEFTADDGPLPQLASPPVVPIHFLDAGPGAAGFINSQPQGGEVQPGVHFLGHFGTAKVAGLSVGFLSGRYKAELFTAATAEEDALKPESNMSWEELRAAEAKAERARSELFVENCYTPLAISRLKEELTDAGGLDLLLTAEWPLGCLKGVTKEARAGLEKAAVLAGSSSAVAELAVSCEPKYHAVGLVGSFFRRPPWRHLQRGEVLPSTGELRTGVCRIVALGSAAEPGGQKWLHGLDLDPDALPLSAADSTDSPWLQLEAPKPAPEDLEPLRPDFQAADREEKRRWMQRFGVKPHEMLQASDRIAKDAEPKEKKEKRQSLYYNQKGEKRFKAGKGGHEGFLQKERRAAANGHVGNF